MGFYGNGQRYSQKGRPEWNPAYFVDDSQRKKELRKYNGGRPPLRVHSTSPDPVAIAVNDEEPQPDEYSPETQKKFSHWFNYGWYWIYWDVVKGSWVTCHERITDQEIWEYWQAPNVLIGLRFDTKTRYALIDIDYGSKYHNKEGLGLIRAALASIGIHETILYKSSNSGGWHLLCPLPEAVNSFKLAQVISIAFSEINLEIAPGQLEIFPNVKSYGKDQVTRFQGHRLPLQVGSCPLDDDLKPCQYSIETLLVKMEQAAASVDFDLLIECLETYCLFFPYKEKESSSDNVVVGLKWHKHPKNPIKWEQYGINWIATGWTAHHQSNFLLGVIAEHGRVFKGIDDESELVDYILKTAIACPGYYEFCRHQHEIEAWCQRWAKSAMRHRYPYGSRKGKFKPLGKGGPTNEEKTALTQVKLSECVEDLGITGRLEKGVKTREKQLIKNLGISKATLWKKNYLPLWHPKYLIAMEVHQSQSQQGIQEKAPHPNINCVSPLPVAPSVPPPVAVALEQNYLIPQVDGSDRIISKIPSSEIIPYPSQVISSFLSSEMNFARFSTLKTSETLDMQAFKTRKHTEKTNNFIRNYSEKVACLVSPKTEVLKIGDRVYHVDRPSYGLTITQIVNDELVKAITDGFKGAEYFPINELMAQLPTDGCSPTKGRSP
jgi:hypothetical protein